MAREERSDLQERGSGHLPAPGVGGDTLVASNAFLHFAKLLSRELRLRSEIASEIDDARWMILLDIYLAMSDGRDTPFMSAAHASRVAVSTAQRYVHEMIEKGLIEQHRSGADQRITHVSLSDKGIALVTQMLDGTMATRTRG